MSKYSVAEFRSYMDEFGLTPPEAAKTMGISIHTMYSWMSGRRTITPGLVDLMLCKHLLSGATFDGERSTRLANKVFEKYS